MTLVQATVQSVMLTNDPNYKDMGVGAVVWFLDPIPTSYIASDCPSLNAMATILWQLTAPSDDTGPNTWVEIAYDSNNAPWITRVYPFSPLGGPVASEPRLHRKAPVPPVEHY